MELSEELVNKWTPVLEAEGAGEIQDSYRRQVTARILENMEQAFDSQSEALQEDSSTPVNRTGNVSKYDPILISLARRSMPNLIAYDLCGVQPMTGPTGLVFSIRPKYVRDGSLAEDAFYDEADTGHSGDGNTQEGTSPAVLNQASPGNYTTGRPVDTETGELLGTTSGQPWQEMGFEIDKFGIEAKERALKAQYSVEMAHDMKQIHGLDAETELANILSSEILAEINREVIRTIYKIAKPGAQNNDLSTQGVFDLDTDSNGRWSAEKFKGMLFQLDRDANAIARETRRGQGNVIICNSDVASALSMTGSLDNSPAMVGNRMTVDDSGNTFAGVLSGRYRVYIDPYHSGDNYYVMGYKGNNPFDAGLYYCPYVPLQLYRAIGEDSFQPRLGFKTRYGMAANPFAEGKTRGNGALNAGKNVYYRRVKVTNLAGTAS